MYFGTIDVGPMSLDPLDMDAMDLDPIDMAPIALVSNGAEPDRCGPRSILTPFLWARFSHNTKNISMK